MSQKAQQEKQNAEGFDSSKRGGTRGFDKGMQHVSTIDLG